MDIATAEPPTSLKQHKAFWYFWFTRLLLTGGFQILTVAIGWQMYELTHSAFNLGIVGLLQFIPRILLVLVTGAVVDRYNRKVIAAISLAVQAIVATLLALGSQGVGFHVTPWLIFALSVVIGICRTFDMPTMQALLPNILPVSLLAPAIAAVASASETATIISPAIGGFLYAWGAVFTYGLDALMYFTGMLLVLQLRPKPQNVEKRRISMDSLLSGIHFIRSRPDILGAISLDLFAVLLGGATALLPIYARDILHTGPWGLGLLRSAPAIGALAMSAWLMRHPIKKQVGHVMFAAVAVFGLATIVFGISTSFALSFAALVVLGCSDIISVVIRTTFIQLETPDEMRGRVGAVNSLFIGASNQLGEFESGLSAAWLGTVPAVVLGGVGTLLVVVLWMKWFPSLAQRDQLVNDPA